jgi:uncharacterized membrane protein/protein-disulfide isomerase
MPLPILSLLSLAGLLVCTLIIATEASLLPGVCTGSMAGCSQVLATAYARPLGIPLSLIGLGFYATTLTACLLPKPPHFYLVIITRLAACGSAVLVFIQFYGIGAICTLCLASACINLLLAITATFLPKPTPAVSRSLRLASSIIAAALLAVTLYIYLAASGQQDRLDPPLATVANVTFRTSDAAAALGTDLTSAADPQSRYLQLTTWLDEQLFHTRLATYAKFLRKTPDDLLAPIFESAKDDPASLEPRLAAFAAELEEKYPATIHLKHPPADHNFAWQDAILLRGQPTAPTRVLVFTDYACPHCRTLAHLLADLIPENSPDIALAYRPAWPTDNHASLQAFTALKASLDAGTHHQTHAALLAAKGNEAAIQTIHHQLAPTPTHQQTIESQLKQSRAWGITAVPSLWINGQPIDPPYSEDQLRQAIQTARRPGN